MTGQPPRLTPAAAPTGAFVRPGRPGPKLLDVNFDALAKLSGTLMEFASTQDQRNFQEGQQITVADAARLDKKLLPALTDPSQDTAAGMEMLKQAGVKGYDNPYVVMGLRQAAAIQRVRDAGLKETLTDPAWFESNARMYSDDKEAADRDLDAQVQNFIKKLGPLGGVAQEAAQNEVLREVESFKAARLNAAGKLFDEKVARQTSLLVNTMAHQWAQDIMGSGDAAARKAKINEGVLGMQNYIRSLGATIGEPAAERAVLKGLKTVASDLAAKEGEDALLYLDQVDAAWENKSTEADDELDQMRREIGYITREREESNNKQRQEARLRVLSEVNTLAYRFRRDNPNMTRSDYEKWFYEGAGNQAILDIVASYKGAVLDQDLGDIRNSVFEDTWRASSVKESDPEVLVRLTELARNNDPKLKDELSVAEREGKLAIGDRLRIRDLKADAESRGELSAEATQARGEAIKMMTADFADLPSDSSAGLYDMRLSMAEAYTEHLKTNQRDWRGAAAAARNAMLTYPGYDQLRQAKVSLTYQGIMADKEFQDTLNNDALKLVQDIGTDLQKESEKSGLDIDNEKLTSLKTKATIGLEDLTQKIIMSKLADPEFRAKPELVRRQEIKRALDLERPKMIAALKRGNPVTKTAPLEPGARLKVMEKDLSWDNIRPEAYSYAPMVPPSRPFRAVEGSTRHIGWTTKTLQELKAGKVPSVNYNPYFSWYDPTTYQSYNVRTEHLNYEVALSAVIRGGRLEEAELLRGNINDNLTQMALGTSNRKEALDNIQGAWLIRGMSLEEVASGMSDFGVSLETVYSKAGDGATWQENFPAYAMALFKNEGDRAAAMAEWEKDPDNSLLGRAAAQLGLGKDEVPKFMDRQKELLVTRGDLSTIREALPTFATQGSIPAWATPIITELRKRHAVR